MNETHREVEAWLQKLYSGDPIPQFEVNHRTLQILSELMKVYEQRELATQLIVKDWQLKAEEYSLEADRIGKLLERFGLTANCLSQSGTVSLKTLVDISLNLETRTASESELLLAMTRLKREKMQVEDALRAEKRLHDLVIERSKTRLLRCTELKRALESIESQAALQGPEMEKKAKQAEFLQTKAREYRRSIEQLKKELNAAGYDPSISHQTLNSKSESLKDLKKRLNVVKSKLDSYQSLPPDLSLARVKIEETKQELVALEAELAQHIDLMHM